MLATSRILRVPRSFIARGCLVSLVAFLVVGCSGSGSSGPPPRQDFRLTVSPSTISVTVGTISPPVLISVVGQNGFSGAVNVVITELPPGAKVLPASPRVLPASGSGQALIFIPPTTPTGALPIQFDATSGSHSDSATLALAVTPVSDTAVLQEVPGQAPAGTIEIQGVSAGPFNPVYWQKNTLTWVPDVRMPLLAAQTTGPYQNIYAPWSLEQPGGWRMFYGGWDGQDVPFDQIFSVTTSDFLSFANCDHIISNGDFVIVNNVNVQQLPDGSLHMVCTSGPLGSPDGKPGCFSSPDGVTWNGSAEPYSARLTDIIIIQGYALFSSGNFNGANVLLRDNGEWVPYFTDWQNDPHTTYRATANTLPNFQLQGVALKIDHAVNDVKKFTINGTSWYLMGLQNE